MKNRKGIKRILGFLALAFLVVFLLRWGYELFFTGNDVVIQYTPSNNSLEYGGYSAKSNIATDRVTKQDVSGQATVIDQKYDKTAQISAYTDSFEEVNQQLRDTIDAHGAVIQMENLSGLAGSQQLGITIGVVPEQFDALVDTLRNMATLRGFTVTKVDKTDEYRMLMAEIATLEKTRDAYTALKEQGGNLQDQLQLEEKILEVEQQLQSKGVDAGLYATENSFCTVNMTLTETATTSISLRFILRCAASSFLWTLGACFIALVLLGLAMAFAHLLLSFGRYHTVKPKAAEENAPSDTSSPTDEELKEP